MSSIAAVIFDICAKDLMLSEARYHSSNNAFVSMVVMPAWFVNTSRKNNKKKCASASLTLLLSGLPSLLVIRP